MVNKKIRCQWVTNGNELYQRYHDNEWGAPQHDDSILFEFLILEGAQAGLSWATILNKRQGYREAFDNFDYRKISKYDEKKIAELLNNPGIIRNKLKVNGTVTNARLFMQVQEEFGSFDKYIWQFVGGKPIINAGCYE